MKEIRPRARIPNAPPQRCATAKYIHIGNVFTKDKLFTGIQSSSTIYITHLSRHTHHLHTACFSRFQWRHLDAHTVIGSHQMHLASAGVCYTSLTYLDIPTTCTLLVSADSSDVIWTRMPWLDPTKCTLLLLSCTGTSTQRRSTHRMSLIYSTHLSPKEYWEEGNQGIPLCNILAFPKVNSIKELKWTFWVRKSTN